MYLRILSAFFLTLTLSFAPMIASARAQNASPPAGDARTVFSQGLKLLKVRQFKKAIDNFTFTIAQEPSGDNLQALAFYHRGLAYQGVGELNLARSDYSRAIKLKTLRNKVLKVVYYNRGLVHDGLKRPNAALADFVSAIDKDPKYAPAYHNLGNVLRKLGRNERAIKNFVKSLELGNPQPYLTYLGLAMAYETVGRSKEAITSLKYALKVRPKFKAARDMLARLTTKSLYTFAEATAAAPGSSPDVTGSLPQNGADEGQISRASPVISGFQRPEPLLRGLVEPETPKKYTRLALRGSLSGISAGRVAIVVPGPGLQRAQRATRVKPVAKKRPAKGKYKAQLGISPTSDKAKKTWFFLRAQHADLLENLKPTFQRVNLGKRGVAYRIQVGPFKTLKAATRLCNAIIERAVNCFPVAKQG